MSGAADHRAAVREALSRLVPGGRPFPLLRVPLVEDECRWFAAGLEAGLFQFHECGDGCPRRAKWGATGPDEFLNPRGAPRHLFSGPHKPQPTFNREYLPHMAAHARAILEFGYPHDQGRADFSQYFTFTRDLITKRKGGGFEADSIFYGADGRPYLHVEVKADPAEITRMAQAIGGYGELHQLPRKLVKEVEYVLDLEPAYLWLVGPGTVDHEVHVWHVETSDGHVRFERVPALPPPP